MSFEEYLKQGEVAREAAKLFRYSERKLPEYPEPDETQKAEILAAAQEIARDVAAKFDAQRRDQIPPIEANLAEMATYWNAQIPAGSLPIAPPLRLYQAWVMAISRWLETCKGFAPDADLLAAAGAGEFKAYLTPILDDATKTLATAQAMPTAIFSQSPANNGAGPGPDPTYPPLSPFLPAPPIPGVLEHGLPGMGAMPGMAMPYDPAMPPGMGGMPGYPFMGGMPGYPGGGGMPGYPPGMPGFPGGGGMPGYPGGGGMPGYPGGGDPFGGFGGMMPPGMMPGMFPPPPPLPTYTPYFGGPMMPNLPPMPPMPAGGAGTAAPAGGGQAAARPTPAAGAAPTAAGAGRQPWQDEFDANAKRMKEDQARRDAEHARFIAQIKS
jgi:hypothetical protein